jgi:ribosomal protein S18 acetylase RimI-like enzyme
LAYSNGSGQVTANVLDWWEGLVTDSEFDRNLAFVARGGDEIVGFCLCWTSSFVKDLVVEPRWRNRGIGSALLSTAIDALRKRSADEVALKVNIYNGAAQRLYRQFGFVQD